MNSNRLAQFLALPEGWNAYQFATTLRMESPNGAVAEMPVPYDPQTPEWWKEQVAGAVRKLTPDFSRRPTQLELAESGRRRAAGHAGAIAEMMVHENRPTMAELVKLKARRPGLWNSFPESRCSDYPGATA